MALAAPRMEPPQSSSSGDQTVKPYSREIPGTVRGRLGDLIGQMVEFGISARGEFETNLDYYDALYEMRVQPRDWPWEDCSNFVVPFIPAQLDSLAARLAGVVFGNPRFFVVNGNTQEALQAQYQVERYYNAELARHNWSEDFYQWLHLSLRDGTCVMEVLWKRERSSMRVSIKVEDTDEFGQPILDEHGQPQCHYEDQILDLSVYDDVELTAVEARDFLVLPGWQTSLQMRGAGCARMKLMSEAELKSMVKSDDNPNGVLWKDAVEEELDQLSEGQSDLPLSNQSTQDYTINDQVDITEDVSNFIPEIPRQRGPMRVWRVHTDVLDLDGDGVPEENVFWIREQSRRLLGFKRYDYLHLRRPFVALTPIPRPGRFYGKSICELLRTVQEELNAIHNQRNDQISLRLSPPMRRTRNADVRDQDNRWGPDAEWIVDTKDDVGIIELPDVPLSSWEEEQFLTQYGYQISGQSAPMTGSVNSSRRTAKEVQQSSSASNVRLDLMAARIRQACKEVFWQIHQLKLQFGPEQMDVTVQAQGMPQKLTIDKKALGQDFDLNIAGFGGPLDKQGREQQMMLVYSMSLQNPIIMQNPMHLYNATRMVFEAIGVPDIQSILGTPEELMQSVQQQQQQAQQQQQFQQKLQLLAAMHGTPPPTPGSNRGGGQAKPHHAPQQHSAGPGGAQLAA